MAAQYSLPYIVSDTLARGPQDYDAYGDDRLDETQILAIADKVETETDASLEQAYPAHFGTGVDLILSDGATLAITVLDSLGTPARPMPMDAVAAKATRVTERAAPCFHVDGTQALIRNLPNLDTVAPLTELLEMPIDLAMVA